MALPTSQVEKYITDPANAQSQGWLGELLLFGITVFSVSILLWAGLHFGYERYLAGKIDALNSQIQKFNQQISTDDRNRIVSFYSQLQNLKSLIAGHQLLSPMFTWLEQTTLPAISYTRLNYSPESLQLGINGTARTSADISSQLKIFENQPNVERVSFNNINATASTTWAFDFTIIFKIPFTAANYPTATPTL